jgi:hypothetical protein
MAKSLVHGYEFDPASGVVYLPGNIRLERLLLITNVTRQEPLFLFNVPALGVTLTSYDDTLEKTAFYLATDTSAMQADDKLQVFIENDYQEFKPTKEFIDPVQKFRVSNPENLIDTDFEYGLQSTKWETLQTVNNIPTVYASSGNLPVEGIQSVDAIEGSKQIRVVTNLAHGLSLGDPISVQGLTQYQAEGYFTVSGVPDPLIFFYELDVQSNVTGDISGGYTTIVPAKFFDGSALPINIEDGAISDGVAPSTLLVTTNETHGFSAGTKAYLRNTVGPKDLLIVDPTLTAPDDRPYVDNTPSFSIGLSVDNQNSTGRGTFRETQTISWDWELTYSNYFSGADFDSTTNQVNWTGHGLHDRAALLFNTPIHAASNGGLTDGYVYYVKVVNADAIQLCTDYETLTSVVPLSSIDDSSGAVRLGLVYKVEQNNGLIRTTASGRRGVTSVNSTFYHYGNNTTYNHNITNIVGAGQNITNFNIYRAYGAGANYWNGYVQHYIGANGSANTNYATTYGAWGGNPNWYGNYNATGFVWTSGGSQYITGRSYSPYGFWGTPFFQATITYSDPAGGLDQSGADLRTATFGLGGEVPEALVGFQGRQPNSYSNNSDNFTALANNKTNGRYGVLNIPYDYDVTAADGVGSFTTTYNDSGLENFGAGAELFYGFARILSSDRNTVYSPNHGVDSQVSATVQIDSTDYLNGERFAFADSTGAVTVVNSQTFSVEIIPVNGDLIRIQITDAPNTDNIARYPRRFAITYIQANDFYNTIYVSNHKITGSETAEYTHSGYELDNYAEYSVTDDGTNTAFVFTTSDVNMDGSALVVGSNPTLELFRGVTYHFAVDATGHPFYIKTSATTGSGDQYTDGVSGNGTEVGVVLFTVPEDAPSALYYACGVHASMQGTINISELPNNIGGLSFGQDYVLSRVNDSRLQISRAVSVDSSATTNAYGYPNNATQVFYVDVETPLGIDPSACTITGIEFRGDFNLRNEYLFITFDDGDSYFIGVNGADSAVWQSELTFGQKDITSLLTVNAGKRSFRITVDPTTQIDRPWGGMTNWWEIRFQVNGDTGSVSLTSSGTGEQKFSIPTLVGAYDGVYTMTDIPSQKEFELAADFTIPPREYVITSALINNVDNTVTFAQAHNLLTGERVTYSENGNPSIFDEVIDELFVIAVDEFTIKFAVSSLSALNNDSTNITPQAGIHYLYTSNVIKGIKGTGFIDTTSGDTAIVGSGTRFLSTFKRFDNIWIEESGILNAYTVDDITTDENMTLFEPVGASLSGTAYFYSTQIILRPDGFSLHKPFDGGVDITAGTSPNSKIVRQSRKYFRYQSGKGIQNSFAVNLNPPRLVAQLTFANPNVVTVETQEVHNLNAGNLFVVKDAEVSSGENPYNGEFTVASVVDPFTFTYEVLGAPVQTKAGGYPSYYRRSWNDAYVRAGMFDDQNGFFYEYDGDKIYCVRRSSTQQIGGTVNAERGSQVITGNRTSFTTQVRIGDKIVIRGQSYLIVEVSSDSRMVVQPAYRGVDARNIKATITVDTRVPQNEWSIDPCDGTGPTGFILNVNKIQMGYADYSWYGAGKIRFGWKDQHGEVKYVHEFTHNNRLDESYFRSGNLPGRYEIENGANANHAPTLFHFGTSIIMDGTFDDDKAYLFTAQSKPFAFTNGNSTSFTTNATSTYQLVTLNGRRVWVYAVPVAEATAQSVSVGQLIRDTSNLRLPEGTYITQVKLDGTSSLIYTSYPALGTEPGPPTYTDIPGSTTMIAGEVDPVDLTQPLPLISIRLAPSVDSSLTGAVGEREIINRMQLQLRQAGVTANQDILIFLILNALPSSLHFDKVQQPSLSELIEHSSGETLLNGTTIYSLKASSGSSEIDLSELLEMGNSILGGDGIFPAGPDLLTLAVQPQNTAGISGTEPFFVSGKISWSESQA